MERRVIAKRYLTLAEARELMEARLHEDSDLITIEHERVWEYLREFGSLDSSSARKAVEDLMRLGLDEVIAVNIVNLCPRDPGEVRLVLAMKKEVMYDEELVNKILEVVSGLCPEE